MDGGDGERGNVVCCAQGASPAERRARLAAPAAHPLYRSRRRRPLPANPGEPFGGGGSQTRGLEPRPPCRPAQVARRARGRRGGDPRGAKTPVQGHDAPPAPCPPVPLPRVSPSRDPAAGARGRRPRTTGRRRPPRPRRGRSSCPRPVDGRGAAAPARAGGEGPSPRHPGPKTRGATGRGTESPPGSRQCRGGRAGRGRGAATGLVGGGAGRGGKRGGQGRNAGEGVAPATACHGVADGGCSGRGGGRRHCRGTR